MRDIHGRVAAFANVIAHVVAARNRRLAAGQRQRAQQAARGRDPRARRGYAYIPQPVRIQRVVAVRIKIARDIEQSRRHAVFIQNLDALIYRVSLGYATEIERGARVRLGQIPLAVRLLSNYRFGIAVRERACDLLRRRQAAVNALAVRLALHFRKACRVSMPQLAERRRGAVERAVGKLVVIARQAKQLVRVLAHLDPLARGGGVKAR